MTYRAVGGKCCRHVVRIRGVLEVHHMTSGTGSIRGSQTEVVVHMAGSASDAHVRAGQRKAGRGVIECRTRPR